MTEAETKKIAQAYCTANALHFLSCELYLVGGNKSSDNDIIAIALEDFSGRFEIKLARSHWPVAV